MRTNAEGISIIREFESLRLSAYLCPGGVWTIGWGHTRGVKQGDVCTADQAEGWFWEDVAIAEGIVGKRVQVHVNENQFSALASWAFNVGDRWDSTLYRRLNARDYLGVAEELPRWRKAQGKVQNGLIRRRAKEVELWLRPVVGIDTGHAEVDEPDPAGFWTLLIDFLKGRKGLAS
jgi:lysozyme